MCPASCSSCRRRTGCCGSASSARPARARSRRTGVEVVEVDRCAPGRTVSTYTDRCQRSRDAVALIVAERSWTEIRIGRSARIVNVRRSFGAVPRGVSNDQRRDAARRRRRRPARSGSAARSRRTIGAASTAASEAGSCSVRHPAVGPAVEERLADRRRRARRRGAMRGRRRCARRSALLQQPRRRAGADRWRGSRRGRPPGSAGASTVKSSLVRGSDASTSAPRQTVVVKSGGALLRTRSVTGPAGAELVALRAPCRARWSR